MMRGGRLWVMVVWAVWALSGAACDGCSGAAPSQAGPPPAPPPLPTAPEAEGDTAAQGEQEEGAGADSVAEAETEADTEVGAEAEREPATPSTKKKPGTSPDPSGSAQPRAGGESPPPDPSGTKESDEADDEAAPAAGSQDAQLRLRARAACTKRGCPPSQPCCNTCRFSGWEPVGARGVKLVGRPLPDCNVDGCGRCDFDLIVDGRRQSDGTFEVQRIQSDERSSSATPVELQNTVRLQMPSQLASLVEKHSRVSAWLPRAKRAAERCYARMREQRPGLQGVVVVSVVTHENARPDVTLQDMPQALSGILPCVTQSLMRDGMPLLVGPEGERFTVRIRLVPPR